MRAFPRYCDLAHGPQKEVGPFLIFKRLNMLSISCVSAGQRRQRVDSTTGAIARRFNKTCCSENSSSIAASKLPLKWCLSPSLLHFLALFLTHKMYQHIFPQQFLEQNPLQPSPHPTLSPPISPPPLPQASPALPPRSLTRPTDPMGPGSTFASTPPPS